MDSLTLDLTTLGLGLLAVRLVFGLVMAAHGAQKLFGWFGGYGLAGTGGFMESLGFRPGRLFAAAAGFSEFTGGVLLALGLLGPVGPALMVSVMVVAAGSVHWKHGIFATANGIEIPLLYAVVGVALALTGPGEYSVDSVLGLSTLWTPALSAAVLGLGIFGGLGNLVLRRPVVAAPVVAQASR
jgi:putative oxidoreductase